LNHNQIAVIGIGNYYPGAKNPKDLWRNILARRRQFRKMPDQRLPLSEYFDADPTTPDKTYGEYAAVIDDFQFDWASKRIPKITYESTDIVHWLALEIANQALEDAGLAKGSIQQEKTGVIVGNSLTGEFMRSYAMRLRWPFVKKVLRATGEQQGLSHQMLSKLEEDMEKVYKSVFAPVSEDTLAGNLSNTIAGRICNYFDLHGGGYVVDGACSSSLLAVATAADKLVNGDLDLAIAGGVDISLDPLEIVGFAKTKALTDKDMNVFDQFSSGFIPGEGSGFIILKRLEDARRDGDYVYSVLRGWGISSDGKGGITAPKVSGQALSLKRAYDMAGYSPHELDFIEAHGTGTTVGDRVELEAIATVMEMFGTPKKRSLGVTSFKSLVGHTKAAAGIGGLIKAILSVNQRIMVPTAGCKVPNEVFEKKAQVLYPILEGEVYAPDRVMKAGVSAMGFGGINCHVTLESGDSPKEDLKTDISENKLLVSSQDTELFIFTANTQEELRKKIKHASVLSIGMSIAELSDLAHHLIRDIHKQAKYRAALIANHPKQLTNRLEKLENKLLQETLKLNSPIYDVENQIWISYQQDALHKIGFLFPGQGSQFINMGRVLIQRFDWAKEIADEAWNHMPEAEKIVFRNLDKKKDQEELKNWEKELRKTEYSQITICLVSVIWFEYLKRLGINPSIVAGHSLGELSALYVSGAFNASTLFHLAKIRGEAMAAPVEDAGVMASLVCSPSKAKQLLSKIEGYAVIANLNSDKQIVISGEKEAVYQAIDLAKEEQIQTYLLPVSNAFHSELVQEASDQLNNLSYLNEDVKLYIPFISGIDGSEWNELKANEDSNYFSKQVISQVRFTDVLDTLREKCDLLVEVGPGRVLSGLVQHDPSYPIDCMPVESKMGHIQDLQHLLALYFIQGGEVNWEVLYENRLVEPFVPAKDKHFIINPVELPLQIDDQTINMDSDNNTNISPFLVKNSGIPSVDLENYLQTRGDFIFDVIRSDMKHQVTSTEEIEIPKRIKEHEEVYSPPKSPELVKEAVNDDNISEFINGVIRQEASNITGYSLESISMRHHVLDDLNLDSIKSADFVTRIFQKLEVTHQIDPTEYSSATLEEIAEVIVKLYQAAEEKHTNSGLAEVIFAKVAKFTGFDEKSLKMEYRLLDDLNLDSIKSAELLSQIVKALKIKDAVDVTEYANAGLIEIIDGLGKFIKKDIQNERSISKAKGATSLKNPKEVIIKEVAKFTGFDEKSLKMEYRLLDDLNLDSIKSAELLSQIVKALKIMDAVDVTEYANASLVEIVDRLSTVNRNGIQKSQRDTSLKKPEEIIIQEVAKFTGFNEKSLKMEYRLLDDLNLDSIKSAELLSLIIKALEITEVVDVTEYANASIKEVNEKLGKYYGKVQEEEIVTSAPIVSASVPNAMLDTSANSKVAFDLRTEEVKQNPVNWVREFVLEYIKVPRSNHNLNFSNKDSFLIVTDRFRNKLAQELGQQLQKYDVKNTITTFSKLKQSYVLKQKAFSHIVVILPKTDLRNDSESMIDRLQSVIQPGLEYGLRASITYIQYGGGKFGSDLNQVPLRASTAKAFASSLHQERPNAKIRVIDLHIRLKASEIVKDILFEIADPEPFIAVGFDKYKQRYISFSTVQNPAVYAPRQLSWNAQDVILVTGGAKGITAECMLGVAATIQAKIALVGTSSIDQSEVQKNMNRFRELGVDCQYYQCDITKADQAIQLIEQVRAEQGEITCFVHGAANLKSKRAEQITKEAFLHEISPKVTGAKNILESLNDHSLKLVVGFSSLAGVSGMAGNTSYGYSNEVLQLMMKNFKNLHPNTQVLVISFGLWDEVGMGTKGGVTQYLEKKGIYPISVAEGVKRFVHLFKHNPGSNHIILTSRIKDFPTWLPKPVDRRQSYRFIDEVVYDHPNVEVIVKHHLKSSDDFIQDHLFNGTYLLPGVFGMEAMAQAVSFVTGINDFSNVLIRNIQFKSPVIVDKEQGTTIEIRAVVLEDGNVRTEIRSETSGFQKIHFSAEFSFQDVETVHEDLVFPEKALNLDIETDFYQPIMFHGSRYYRITSIYDAFFDKEKGLGRTLFSVRGVNYADFLLGDPYLQDALLQSGRIIAPQDLFLPVEIEEYRKIEANQSHGIWRGIAKFVKQVDQQYIFSIVLLDEYNRVVQQISDYKVHILEHFPSFPTANELVDLSYTNENRIKEALYTYVIDDEDCCIPEIGINILPGIHQDSKEVRHQRVEALFKSVARKKGLNPSVELSWKETGKPFIYTNDLKPNKMDVSIAHDDDFTMCVIDVGAQGCDILPIEHREEEKWIAIFPMDCVVILNDLQDQGDTLDIAGSRIWTCLEAAKKASGQHVQKIELFHRIENVVELIAHTETFFYHVITVPVQLTSGIPRMIAFVKKEQGISIQEEVNELKKPSTNLYGYDDQEKGFVYRFPVVFEDSSTISRRVNFSSYAKWMGKVREMFVSEIMEKVKAQMASGIWGMATNFSQTEVFGEAKSDDIIEAHLQLEFLRDDSYVQYVCNWHKVLENGELERIAMTRQGMTWVEITGHGEVKKSSYPPYFIKFFKERLPGSFLQESVNESMVLSPEKLGKLLYDVKSGPDSRAILNKIAFETSLEESNLVGNVYFANYTIWQNVLRDKYFYQLAPELYRGIGELGEWIPIRNNVQHLREAMPFDTIVVEMSLAARYEFGVKLFFEYFKLEENGTKRKLSFGEQDVIWMNRDDKGMLHSANIPLKISEALKK
jgi:acyl transferase domain-containing protein/NAD(P)-dependent dehydrogenase (short-subunit alcohol dehydrogenase family)/acyl carrier protein/3-hydroxymyristoyl/3-hydroxydecanoyl-(acyl carrier protein) dehydratase/acyl-CoA thioesterase FadM